MKLVTLLYNHPIIIKLFRDGYEYAWKISNCLTIIAMKR